MSVNVVTLVGNLGQDPEIRQFPNGGRMAKISLATKSTWVDRQSGERKTATEWHNVVFNGKLAEIAENYLHKGMRVYIKGSLRTRSYENQQQQTVRKTEIVAQEMRMLGSAPQQQQGQNPQYTTIPSDTDELPPFMEMDSPF